MLNVDDGVTRNRVADRRRAADPGFAGTGFDDPIWRGAGMDRVVAASRRAARGALPILIEGEAGVGKRTLACAIHAAGTRPSRRFTVFDCRAAADQADLAALLERAAARRRPGARRKGTVLLAGIGALPRVLQERLAGALSAATDDGHESPRFVATTTRRLVDLASEGAIVEDLFHHLNVMPIWIPPLRERRDAIPAMADALLLRAASGRVDTVGGISSEAMDVIRSADWPGNLRQLAIVLDHAFVIAGGAPIRPPHVVPLIGANPADSGVEGGGSAADMRTDSVAFRRHASAERDGDPAADADRLLRHRYGHARLLDERGELRRIQSLEEEVIRFALDHYRGRLSEVARRLGIGRSTLYRKLREYGIATGEASAG